MLLTVVSLAFLIAPCSSQTGLMGPVIGISPPKQCLSQKIAPDQSLVRQALYYSVNNLRRQFAKGEDVFPDILYKKGPRLMYAMRYSCDLEKKAFYALQYSKRSEEYFQLNYDSKLEEKGKRDLTSYLRDAATQWKGEHSLGPATLMNPYVPFFGCAYNYKEGDGLSRFRLLCLFDKKDFGVPRTRNMTPPCAKDSDCKRFRDSICQDSLCWGPKTPYNIQ